MTKKNLSENDEKNIKMLQAQNEMYKKTLEQAKIRGDEKAVEQIENAQREMAAQASMVNRELGKELIDEFNKSSKDDDIYESVLYGTRKDDTIDVFAQLKEIDNEASDVNDGEVKDITIEADNDAHTEEYNDASETVEDGATDEIGQMNGNAQFDIIPLPSNGECYPSKKGRLPVAYLTAYDENMITSPNLYRDGLVIDCLLKNKVLDKEFNIEDLVTGDADAIVLFLRATSYGTDFPITVKDPKTGKMIDSTVDLSMLKTRKFKLKGDKEGLFDFTLPITKKKVKFKYLTRKEEKMLEKLSRYENDGIRASSVNGVIETIKSLIKTEDLLDGKEKQIILDSTDNLMKWAKKVEAKHRDTFSKSVTNRMEFQIVEYDGLRDRKKIHEAVMNMSARDALMLRRYIVENEPGVDFEITVERPQSLGGGSFKTFLEWDDTIFLNIA